MKGIYPPRQSTLKRDSKKLGSDIIIITIEKLEFNYVKLLYETNKRRIWTTAS